MISRIELLKSAFYGMLAAPFGLKGIKWAARETKAPELEANSVALNGCGRKAQRSIHSTHSFIFEAMDCAPDGLLTPAATALKVFASNWRYHRPSATLQITIEAKGFSTWGDSYPYWRIAHPSLPEGSVYYRYEEHYYQASGRSETLTLTFREVCGT